MRTIIGVIGTEEVLENLGAGQLPGVAETMRITAPYKLVSAENHAKRTTVRVGGVPIGPDTFTLIAGPCAVESPEQTVAAAAMAKRAGATLMRGGAYKPRTSPYAFQGLRREGLRILAEAGAEVGLPVVTEVMDVSEVDVVAEYADDAADRYPQYAELRFVAGGRLGRQAGHAQAGAGLDLRGMADGGRVHRAARQPRHRVVRARYPLVRAVNPQPARRVGRGDDAPPVAPADHRRSRPMRPAAAIWWCRWRGPESPPERTA